MDEAEALAMIGHDMPTRESLCNYHEKCYTHHMKMLLVT